MVPVLVFLAGIWATWGAARTSARREARERQRLSYEVFDPRTQSTVRTADVIACLTWELPSVSVRSHHTEEDTKSLPTPWPGGRVTSDLLGVTRCLEDRANASGIERDVGIHLLADPLLIGIDRDGCYMRLLQ